MAGALRRVRTGDISGNSLAGNLVTGLSTVDFKTDRSRLRSSYEEKKIIKWYVSLTTLLAQYGPSLSIGALTCRNREGDRAKTFPRRRILHCAIQHRVLPKVQGLDSLWQLQMSSCTVFQFADASENLKVTNASD